MWGFPDGSAVPVLLPCRDGGPQTLAKLLLPVPHRSTACSFLLSAVFHFQLSTSSVLIALIHRLQTASIHYDALKTASIWRAFPRSATGA